MAITIFNTDFKMSFKEWRDLIPNGDWDHVTLIDTTIERNARRLVTANVSIGTECLVKESKDKQSIMTSWIESAEVTLDGHHILTAYRLLKKSIQFCGHDRKPRYVSPPQRRGK